MTIEIPDSHVQHAFDILRSHDHARAKAAHEWSEKNLKAVVARLAAQSNANSAAQREAEALASEGYREALADHRDVAEVYYLARDRRDAASAILDGWRTLSADQRATASIR